MYCPEAAVKQPQIKAAIADALRVFQPAVQKINYEIAPDWNGEWAVFFYVLLSDESSDEEHLRDLAPKVMWRMTDQLNLPELELFPYFHFRSRSEQRQVAEPAWA